MKPQAYTEFQPLKEVLVGRSYDINFLDSLGNPYHYLAKDIKGKQSVNFGIYGIPESILIDKDFIVIKKFVGPLNFEDLNEIKKIVSSL